MYENLDRFAHMLPQADPARMSWSELHDHHLRNARRMRAEAFRQLVVGAGRGLARLGRRLTGRSGRASGGHAARA